MKNGLAYFTKVKALQRKASCKREDETYNNLCCKLQKLTEHSLNYLQNSIRNSPIYPIVIA